MWALETLGQASASSSMEINSRSFRCSTIDSAAASPRPGTEVKAIGGRQYELSLRDTAAGFRLTGADRDSLYLEREGTVYGVKRCDE